MEPPRFKNGKGKGQSTGRLQERHQVADEVVMEPPSKNKKRKKATAEMCTNPPAPILGTLAVDKDKQPPLSKKKKLSTPSIWANGKVRMPTRCASHRRRISCPCRKRRSSDVLLSADTSIALSSACSSPMHAQAEPVTPLCCLRSPWTKTEAGQLKLNFNNSCKGKSRSRGEAEQHQGAGEIHMEPPGCKKRNGKGQSTGEIRGAHQVAYELVVVPPRSKNNKRKKAALAVHKDRQPTPSKKKKLNRNLHGLSKPLATTSIQDGKVVSSAPRLCKQRGSVGMPRKPDTRRLKLNFDGSSRSSAAFGGVFRDPKGKFVLGYAGRIGKATSSVAELVALKRGLQLALDNGWRAISIEGDSKTTIDAMEGHARVRAKEDAKHFTAITKMLPRLGKVAVTHVGREGNKVVDRFAKLGHKAAAQQVWHGIPPDEVLVLLRRDAKSKAKLKTKKK